MASASKGRCWRCRQTGRSFLQLVFRERAARQVCCALAATDGVLFRLLRSAWYRVCVRAVLYSARCCSCRSGAVHRLQACSLARSPAARQRRVLLLLPLLLLAMLLPEKMQLRKGETEAYESCRFLDWMNWYRQAPWCQERQSSKRLASKSTSE